MIDLEEGGVITEIGPFTTLTVCNFVWKMRQRGSFLLFFLVREYFWIFDESGRGPGFVICSPFGWVK